MAYLLDQLRTLIEWLILTLGYPGLALIMFLENLFPPIPSEVVLPFAGSLVADGRLSLVWVLVSSTIGATLGTGLFYYLGLRLGEARTRRLLQRYGRFIGLDEDDLDRSLALFRRFERGVIFFGRFMPAVRTLISLPAGVARMRLGVFLFFTALGTFAWNALLVGAGVLLGERWEEILATVDRFELVLWAVIALLVGWFVVDKLRRRRSPG